MRTRMHYLEGDSLTAVVESVKWRSCVVTRWVVGLWLKYVRRVEFYHAWVAPIWDRERDRDCDAPCYRRADGTEVRVGIVTVSPWCPYHHSVEAAYLGIVYDLIQVFRYVYKVTDVQLARVHYGRVYLEPPMQLDDPIYFNITLRRHGSGHGFYVLTDLDEFWFHGYNSTVGGAPYTLVDRRPIQSKQDQVWLRKAVEAHVAKWAV